MPCINLVEAWATSLEKLLRRSFLRKIVDILHASAGICIGAALMPLRSCRGRMSIDGLKCHQGATSSYNGDGSINQPQFIIKSKTNISRLTRRREYALSGLVTVATALIARPIRRGGRYAVNILSPWRPTAAPLIDCRHEASVCFI